MSASDDARTDELTFLWRQADQLHADGNREVAIVDTLREKIRAATDAPEAAMWRHSARIATHRACALFKRSDLVLDMIARLQGPTPKPQEGS